MTAIRHTVAFALPFAAGSDEERSFLNDARALAVIDGVRDFTVLRSIGAEPDLPLTLSMAFADRAGYDAYNAHPAHRRFVERVWLPTVTAFVEQDFAIETDHGASSAPKATSATADQSTSGTSS